MDDQFLDYLKALAHSINVDDDTTECVNPKLALSARIQLRIIEFKKSEKKLALLKDIIEDNYAAKGN